MIQNTKTWKIIQLNENHMAFRLWVARMRGIGARMMAQASALTEM